MPRINGRLPWLRSWVTILTMNIRRMKFGDGDGGELWSKECNCGKIIGRTVNSGGG